MGAPAHQQPSALQWKSPEEQERRKRQRHLVRNWFRRRLVTAQTVAFETGRSWLLPWDRKHYPGVIRGTQQLLGNRVSARAIEGWIRRPDGTPLWAIDRLLAEINAQLERGLEARERLLELRRERDKPKQARGLQIIGEDGLPKHRWRGGRRQVEEAARRKAEREV